MCVHYQLWLGLTKLGWKKMGVSARSTGCLAGWLRFSGSWLRQHSARATWQILAVWGSPIYSHETLGDGLSII
jgi:hypothetical protein